jgi:hypothetical protein
MYKKSFKSLLFVPKSGFNDRRIMMNAADSLNRFTQLAASQNHGFDEDEDQYDQYEQEESQEDASVVNLKKYLAVEDEINNTVIKMNKLNDEYNRLRERVSQLNAQKANIKRYLKTSLADIIDDPVQEVKSQDENYSDEKFYDSNDSDDLSQDEQLPEESDDLSQDEQLPEDNDESQDEQMPDDYIKSSNKKSK